MNFIDFFCKILPLYLLIGVGFMVGRRTKLNAADLAHINLYYIAPVVFFDAISRASLSWANAVLPLACFVLMGGMAVIIFWGIDWCSKDYKKPYWLTAACTNSNLGYLGIPVFVMMFGREQLGLYMLYLAGAVAFFYTVVNYLLLRGRYPLRYAFINLSKLPIMYALLAGIACQFLHWRIPPVFDEPLVMIQGAYSVLGMMIIGLALGQQSESNKGFVFEWQLIGFSNLIRLVIYPATAMGLVVLDRHFLQLFSPITEQIILLVSIMPMGVDTTSLAAQWNMHPERIAALTLINTIAALFYIPLILPLLVRF